MTSEQPRRRMSVEEQIRALERSGGAMKYPLPPVETHPDVRNIATDVYRSVHPEMTTPDADLSPEPHATSVSPTTSNPTRQAPDTGTSMGRGNLHAPSVGDNIPPRVPGLQLPEPTQTDVPSEPELSFGIVVPKDGRDPYVVTGPGHGNPYGPHGVISPRTAGGQPANDPDYLAKTLRSQLEHPVEMPHKEDVISDVNMGPATSGIGVTTVRQLRDQADNQGQAGAGARQTPIGAGMTGKQSTDNPDATFAQSPVPPSQLGSRNKPKRE